MAKRTKPSKESRSQKQNRFRKGVARTIRKVSGWNIFQREHLQTKQLSKSEYKGMTRRLGKDWRTLQTEERDVFHIQAEFEQGVRKEVLETPLPSKGQALSSKEQVVGSSGLKKMSCQRLVKNYMEADAHPAWKVATQMGDRSLKSRKKIISSCHHRTLHSSPQFDFGRWHWS